MIYIKQDLTCPFCNESDFDSIGLKLHLTLGHCEEYENVPSPNNWYR